MNPASTRQYRRQQIHGRLRDDIASGRLPEGAFLPSFRKLAQQYGVSIRPVQQAMEQLEEEGYIERRQGAGTVVRSAAPAASLQEGVAICLEKGAHIYGTLFDMLNRTLTERGEIPFSIDLTSTGTGEALLRLARGGVSRFVVHLHEYFKMQALEGPLKHQALCIGAIHWDNPPLPRMAAVLSDPVAGARLWVEYLRAHGHKRILLATTMPDKLEKRTPLVTKERLHYGQLRHGTEFIEQWEAAGGAWTPCILPSDPVHALGDEDSHEVLTHLAGPDSPTAVVGYRDYDTYRVQRALLGGAPERARELTYLGYYDTPWSQAAPLPMATVSIDLEAILAGILQLLAAPPTAAKRDSEILLIPPRLVEPQAATAKGEAS